MTAETARELRIINGAALSEAIADLAAELDDRGNAGPFALIASLWKSLPPEAVDGIVHHAATKVGPVSQRETFAAYRAEPAPHTVPRHRQSEETR